MLQRCLAVAVGVSISGFLLASQGFAQAFVPPPDRRPGPGIGGLPVGRIGIAGPERAALGSCRLIPLWFGDPPEYAQQFYAKTSGVTAMEQVKFIGLNKQKALSADWLTVFATPFRVAAGTTVTDTRTADATQEDSNLSSNAVSDDLLMRFSQGGDIYLTGTFPIFACIPASDPDETLPFSRFFVLFMPRIGMVAPWLGTNVPTEVQEWNLDTGIELYADWGPKDFKAFVQMRLALQKLSPAFASALKIPNDSFFPLNQFSIGLQLAFLRVSFYKLLSAPDTPFSEYKSGKLLVQLLPLTIGK